MVRCWPRGVRGRLRAVATAAQGTALGSVGVGELAVGAPAPAVTLAPAAPVARALDFEALFRQHYRPITRSLALAFGSAEDAADAVQEAFLRAYGRWDRIGRYDDPVAWIRHIAINRLRDGFRSRTRARKALARLAPMAQRDAEPVVDEGAPVDPEVLARRLGSLSREQRLALSLFSVEDLSVAEVAASMGISTGAVKFHLHQAREALRRRLERLP
jgi:RNA polymerase sigma-70 factor, ECF subfamily